MLTIIIAYLSCWAYQFSFFLSKKCLKNKKNYQNFTLHRSSSGTRVETYSAVNLCHLIVTGWATIMLGPVWIYWRDDGWVTFNDGANTIVATILNVGFGYRLTPSFNNLLPLIPGRRKRVRVHEARLRPSASVSAQPESPRTRTMTEKRRKQASQTN